MKSLKNKSKINELFTSNSRSIYTPTVKARFISGDSEVLISTPIKLFKRAVDRNRIKRLIRESLKTKLNKGFTIALIYNSSKIETFEDIDKDIKKIFDRM